MRKNAGFSLLELMITVVVIGILVTLAIPNYVRTTERSKIALALSNLRELRKAELDWFVENESFTDTIANLEGQVGANFNSGADWTYTIASDDATMTFTVTGTRNGGPESTDTVTINQNEAWGGTYPLANYGMD
ncbi:MAG: prepilin-type N-terminal cleavage/methylation domain-containing protein [PVC group bacterium]|nr:prepilin-type N-terminal cleavage/methylation domain-containing protein [PVC group bacterium]